MAFSSYYPQLVEQRRQLHKWPEPGWTEFTTTYYLAKRLKEWGYEVLLGTHVVNPESCFGREKKDVEEGLRIARERGVSEEFLKATEGYTGCVGVLDTGRPGPTMATSTASRCRRPTPPITFRMKRASAPSTRASCTPAATTATCRSASPRRSGSPITSTP